MTYFPKNKIQTNLYTPGGEFILALTQTEYIGYYYKLYNGKYYTGRTPSTPNTEELFFLTLSPPPVDSGASLTKIIPYSPILPTPQDYKNGVFIRYFNLKRNQPIFTEIDKDTYQKFQQKDSQVPWKTYKVFSLFWELTGDINKVAQTNKNITELAEQREKALGLSLYLKKDWTQYYKANI